MDAAEEVMHILTGYDDEDDDGDPGYERDAVQRREDCARVRDLLADGLSALAVPCARVRSSAC